MRGCKFILHLAQEAMQKQIETFNRRGYRLVIESKGN